MAILNKIVKKLKAGSWYPFYHSFYRFLPIRSRQILLESGNGLGAESQIFSLLRSLSGEKYREYFVVLSVKKEWISIVQDRLRQAELSRVRIVRTGSLSYYRALSQSRFLVTDTSFPGRYIKKEGQILLNTWHGTPLKKMGKDNLQERGQMGNVLRNLLQSDYLVFPNRFMQEKMTQAYSLDKLYEGTILHTGYPRNDVFFRPLDGVEKKKQLGYENLRLYAYMPTYRGKSDHTDREGMKKNLAVHLEEMDGLLTDDEILLVKLHPFESSLLGAVSFRHIVPFPAGSDTYEVLNACDALVTDYSSVMFDYACTGRAVILFAFDREEYQKQRGCYEKLENLPFVLADTPSEVIEQARDLCLPGKNPENRYPRDFVEQFLTWENGHGCEDVLDALLTGTIRCETTRLHTDSRKNVLLYAGDFALNGITTAFRDLYSLLDMDRYNYFISYRLESVMKDLSRLDFLPAGADLYPIASEMNMDLLTGLAHFLFLRFGIRHPWVEGRIRRAYELEWRKHFLGVHFHRAIHYNGCENYMLSLFSYAPVPYVVWIHNDMEQEFRLKRNVSRYALTYAYKNALHIAAVSESSKKSAAALLEQAGIRKPIQIVPNCLEQETVPARARQPVSFESGTRSTVSCGKLENQESLEMFYRFLDSEETGSTDEVRGRKAE